MNIDKIINSYRKDTTKCKTVKDMYNVLSQILKKQAVMSEDEVPLFINLFKAKTEGMTKKVDMINRCYDLLVFWAIDELINQLNRQSVRFGIIEASRSDLESNNSITVLMNTGYRVLKIFLTYSNGPNNFPMIELADSVLHPKLGISNRLFIPVLYEKEYVAYNYVNFFEKLKKFFDRDVNDEREIKISRDRIVDIDEVARLIIDQDYENKDNEGLPIFENINIEQICNIVYHPKLDEMLRSDLIQNGIKDGALNKMVWGYSQESLIEFNNQTALLPIYPGGNPGQNLSQIEIGKNIITKLKKFLEYSVIGRSQKFPDQDIVMRMQGMGVYLHQDAGNVSGLSENIEHVKYVLEMLKTRFKGDWNAIYTWIGKLPTAAIAYCLDGITEMILTKLTASPNFKNKEAALNQVFQTISNDSCEKISSWQDFLDYGTKDRVRSSFYDDLEIRSAIKEGLISQKDVEDYFIDYGWEYSSSQSDSNFLDCDGKFDSLKPAISPVGKLEAAFTLDELRLALNTEQSKDPKRRRIVKQIVDLLGTTKALDLIRVAIKNKEAAIAR